MKRTARIHVATAVLALTAVRESVAQTGGFVVTLGSDTLHVERFARTANRIDGVIVTRSPATRVARYSLSLAPDGTPLRYEIETRQPDGSPIVATGMRGSITYLRDSVVRETLRQAESVTHRIAAVVPPFPGPSIPYVGVSYLMYELAFADARRRGAPAEMAIHLVTMNPGQTTPQRIRAWLPFPDSAELDYFGIARSGYRFNGRGDLIRADWRNTTYRYRVARVDTVDVDGIARSWAEADRRGNAMGALSPRDTARTTIGGATITVDYSRPATRGRIIWGDVVPWNRVWRLGADVATHFTTSADLRIGDVDVPAGAYTLWMVPAEGDSARLIINTQTRIFGTNYNPARDLARIPLSRSLNPTAVERLTIGVDAGVLWIRWADLAWSATVMVK
jgi:hypothetical protein